jgi:formate hydrogenlyase subunit 4
MTPGAMTLAFNLVLRLAVWMLLAPLLPGLINKVKAWMAGRQGPPVFNFITISRSFGKKAWC